MAYRLVLAAAGFTSILLSPVPGAGSEVPLVQWERTFGTPEAEGGRGIDLTSDGGYIICGLTGIGGDQTYGQAYLLRIDAGGDEVWSKTFSGRGRCGANSVLCGHDGAYVMTGFTSPELLGKTLFYLIKVDEDGQEMWSQVLGDDVSYAYGEKVIQDANGGYAAVGTTISASSGDVFLVTLDADGTIRRELTIQEDGAQSGRDLLLAEGGGFVIVGDAFVDETRGADVYLLEVDMVGRKVWGATYGEEGEQRGRALSQVRDGGYIIAGHTWPSGADTQDVYLVRTDAHGVPLWERTYGGTDHDTGQSVVQTPDGGFLVVGTTRSFGSWPDDVYVLKTDSAGNEVWSRRFGGDAHDWGCEVRETPDAGYVVVGATETLGQKPLDVYVIKLGPESVPFIRGHVNSDAVLDIADAVCLLSYLFGSAGADCGGLISGCLDAADANDDGSINLGDPISVLMYLFGARPPLPPPFTSCGDDERPDDLRCLTFQGCSQPAWDAFADRR